MKAIRKRRNDLSGQRFFRLLITGPTSGGWAYQCDCGVTGVTSQRSALTRGVLKSCGCWRRERESTITGNTTLHGAEYVTWLNMRRRCYNPKNGDFKYYGARGITVCDEWRNDFTRFITDMGECPVGYSIERKDNDSNYTPQNCEWAPKLAQANNTRTNRFLEFNGRRMTVAQWTRALGFPHATLTGRLSLGWSVERALTAPLRQDSRR